jgi:hypothetical protein
MTRCAMILTFLTLAPLAAQAASDQSFTRIIKLKDKLDLAIVSGAGTVQISRGPEDRLTITGHVRANDWRPTDDRLRDIAARPPIYQDKNIVRIGSTEELTHVIIDYEIEAPADSVVQASASVGDIFDDGVGMSVRFNTGSGNIHATGLLGSIDVNSKEGDIEVQQHGQGEVKAVAGTGSITLSDVRGALQATADAGNMTISGVPAGDWSVKTGRGNIELTLGNAACTIHAQTVTGLVHSNLKVEGASNSDPHQFSGNINGGGHNVILQARDGEIRIQ